MTPGVAVATVASADAEEAVLLGRFVRHPVLRDIDALSDERFLDVLLQRRFISLIFAPVYDMGIDALTDADAIRLVREIVREEYPGERGDKPSHREELVADLLALGATKRQILASRPTAATLDVLTSSLGLMADAGAGASDLGVLTILRFWGEVVVAVEYGEYWRRMGDRFGAPSRFYYEHYSHDGRDALTTASATSATHSGRLGAHVAGRLAAPGALEAFVEIERRIVDTRLRFYDQFLDEGRG